jgi:RNA polymerase sigma factor (sigma-70 family)
MPLALAAAPVAEVTTGACAGDEAAWRDLVRRFDPMLRGIVKGYRLDSADAEDVVQTTWIRAYRNLDRLNEPAAIGGWLAVTARREALRTFQRGVREFPAAEPRGEEADGYTPELAAFEGERREAVRDAVLRLPTRQRELLTAMLDTPGVSYEELSAALQMPTGSIGPTRVRALGALRRDAVLTAVVAS